MPSAWWVARHAFRCRPSRDPSGTASSRSSARRDSSIPDPVPEWAHRLLHTIAVPRLPGSAALPGIEDALTARLEAWGYHVSRHSFPTSPARLTAVSVAGAGLGWVALLVVPLAAAPVNGLLLALVGWAALLLVGLLALGIAERRLPIPQPIVQGVNVEARRGEPKLWLVAHSDSKGQFLSLRGRVVAAALAAVGAVGLLVLLGVRIVRPVPIALAAPVALVALVGGAALSRGSARDDSPGAVDNASGVLAVLEAARLLQDRDDVGVLITGAEEYGMEGARAWVKGEERAGWFLNVDGIDGRGAYRVMIHRPAGARSPVAGAVTAHVVSALAALGHEAKVGALPPGVLVDGVVLARAGLDGVTLSRGTWRTLGVVHTREDVPERLDLDAVLRTGEAIAGAAARLLS